MKKTTLTLPELGLIASTRVAIGAGIGLLVSGLLSRQRRNTTGWTLLAAGALSTIPIGMKVFGKR